LLFCQQFSRHSAFIPIETYDETDDKITKVINEYSKNYAIFCGSSWYQNRQFKMSPWMGKSNNISKIANQDTKKSEEGNNISKNNSMVTWTVDTRKNKKLKEISSSSTKKFIDISSSISCTVCRSKKYEQTMQCSWG